MVVPSRVPAGEYVPTADHLHVPLLASFLDRPTAIQAVKAFRAALTAA